jgi:hypothetical protein
LIDDRRSAAKTLFCFFLLALDRGYTMNEEAKLTNANILVEEDNVTTCRLAAIGLFGICLSFLRPTEERGCQL